MHKSTLFPYAWFFNVALHTGACKKLGSPVLYIGNVISNLEMHVMCYFTILSPILENLKKLVNQFCTLFCF